MGGKEVRREDVLRGSGTRKPEWNYTCFYDWLRQEGFFCIDSSLFRVEDHVAKRCNLKDVSEYVLDNLLYDRTPSGRIRHTYPAHLEMFNRSRSTYLNEKNLLLVLGEYSGKELADDKDHAYFLFLNGIVVVDRRSVELREYRDVLTDDMFVYDSKIIKRNVAIEDEASALRSPFADFCRRAIDGEDYIIGGYKYLMRAFGYMLHKYKDPATAKMVLFSDCNNVEGIAEGRTGKSLCAMVALGQMRNLATIDGKQIDAKDKYMLDNVDRSTDIVCMQDLRADFRQDVLNNLITGDFQIGRKYYAKMVIPFAEAPKIIADSNYAVKLNGGSDFARIVVIGFSHYFTYKRTPQMLYKRRFFDDWGPKDWDRFYMFMFLCVKKYLNDGVESYRLNDIMSYSVYNRYPAELCDEIRDMLADKDCIFLVPTESNLLFENIAYFSNVATDIGRVERMRMLTMLMRDYGYARHNAKKTNNAKEGSPKAMYYWWEKVSDGKEMLGSASAINSRKRELDAKTLKSFETFRKIEQRQMEKEE